MDIDTGDSFSHLPKPETLPLKYATWVQQELDILERAGVIIGHLSPWGSPIIIVPKRTSPAEMPRELLCVGHRIGNKLLLSVMTSNSKQMNSYIGTFARDR